MNTKDIREKAVAACRAANGDDWKSMYSGDQEAQIESWVAGYLAATADFEAARAQPEQADERWANKVMVITEHRVKVLQADGTVKMVDPRDPQSLR